MSYALPGRSRPNPGRPRMTIGVVVNRYLQAQHPAHGPKEVSRKAGLPIDTCKAIYYGRSPSADTLARLLSAYGWPLWQAIGRELIGDHDHTAVDAILDDAMANLAAARAALTRGVPPDETTSRLDPLWRRPSGRAAGPLGLAAVAAPVGAGR